MTSLDSIILTVADAGAVQRRRCVNILCSRRENVIYRPISPQFYSLVFLLASNQQLVKTKMSMGMDSLSQYHRTRIGLK